MARIAERFATADHVLSWSASKEVAYLGGVDGGDGGRSYCTFTCALIDMDSDESGMQ